MSQRTQTETAIPVNERLLRLEQDGGLRPVLVGARCPSCEHHFFPRRTICPGCGHEGLETVDLSGRGKVWTYTIAHQVPPGAIVKAPYVIAQVELPEHVLVGALIQDCAPEDVHIGMDVEITPVVVGQDEDGRQRVAFAFRPVQG